MFIWFQFDNKDQLYEYLVECDVIVYDITADPDQIDEAVWAVSGMCFFYSPNFWNTLPSQQTFYIGPILDSISAAYIGPTSDVQLGYTSGRYRQPISAADMQPILCRHSKIIAFSR